MLKRIVLQPIWVQRIMLEKAALKYIMLKLIVHEETGVDV